MVDPLMELKTIPTPNVSPDARSRALKKLEARIATSGNMSIQRRPSKHQLLRGRFVAASGVALATAALIVGGGSPLNNGTEPSKILNKAAAATSPQSNQILYERSTYRTFGTDEQGNPAQEELHYESWTLDDLNWHTVIRNRAGRVIVDEEVNTNGRRLYRADKKKILSEPRTKTSAKGQGAANILERVLTAVKHGEGTILLDGTHKVRGHTTNKFVFIPKADSILLQEIIYVDTETDLPVRSEALYQEGFSSTEIGGSVSMDIHRDITDYEKIIRLPNTTKNHNLLKMQNGRNVRN